MKPIPKTLEKLYSGLELHPSDEALTASIAIAESGDIRRWKDEDSMGNSKYATSLSYLWHGWLYGFDAQEPSAIIGWHVRLFEESPSKSLDRDQISLLCWQKLYQMAQVMQAGKRLKGKLPKGRTVIVRTFKFLPDGNASALNPQQVRVLGVFQRACKGLGRCNENELKEAMRSDTGRADIQTRMHDPYMLWTNYAALFKKAGLLEVVKNKAKIKEDRIVYGKKLS